MHDLSSEQIRAGARGVYAVREEAQGMNLLRFPDSALAYYAPTEHYRLCAQCHPGVRLDAYTESRNLALTVAMRWIYPLSLCCDLFVDGVFRGSLQTAETSEVRFPDGQALSGSFVLGATHRMRRVTLYLPHLASLYLQRVQLDDGASWTPVPEEPVWLALGDSITQGGTSVYPSAIYTAVAARALGMSLHNRGVGGMVFDADSLPEAPLTSSPAGITVAYGVNDWSAGRDVAEARRYLIRLRECYPATPIAVLSPVYCTNRDADALAPAPNSTGQTLEAYRAALAEIVSEFPAMQWVPAEDLLPRDPAMLYDRLHPSTTGHQCYGENLATCLQRLGWSTRHAGSMR